jgi:hypothetical protein
MQPSAGELRPGRSGLVGPAGTLRGEMWDGLARRLEGEIVVLEPLEAHHEEGL